MINGVKWTEKGAKDRTGNTACLKETGRGLSREMEDMDKKVAKAKAGSTLYINAERGKYEKWTNDITGS